MKVKTLLALAAGMLLAAPAAEARITKVVIDSALSQSPTFGGYSWPGVGQYERLIGTAYGEVNPSDRKNSVIVDVGLAPRNTSGNVDISLDVAISHKAVRVPSSAVIADSRGVHVAVVDESGRVHLVAVTPGPDDGNTIELVAGLSGGEQVISTPPSAVTDGMQVQPVSTG